MPCSLPQSIKSLLQYNNITIDNSIVNNNNSYFQTMD